MNEMRQIQTHIMLMQIQLLSISDVRAITDPTERVCGEIKLSLQYHRGALTVMVCDSDYLLFNCNESLYFHEHFSISGSSCPFVASDAQWTGAEYIC